MRYQKKAYTMGESPVVYAFYLLLLDQYVF